MDRKIILSEYDSPCGRLILGSVDGRLCLCDWTREPRHTAVLDRVCRLLKAEAAPGKSEVNEMAARQLDDYFAHVRTEFEVPLEPAGTDFQKKVWDQLAEVAYGRTTTYSSLASALGCPKSVRAVANAVGANPLSIFIPCHRIIGSNGSLTGYAGGLAAKEYLLDLESDPA